MLLVFLVEGKLITSKSVIMIPPLRSSTVLDIDMRTVLKRGSLCVSCHKFTRVVRLSMFSELNVSTLNLYHDECTYIVHMLLTVSISFACTFENVPVYVVFSWAPAYCQTESKYSYTLGVQRSSFQILMLEQ
jgi:hypothetical protein